MPPLTATQRHQLLTEIRRGHEQARRSASTGALSYLQHVLIDRAGEPTPYRVAAEPWQWGLAARLAPAVDRVVGVRKEYTGPRCFWLTLPRGHDKTGLIGRLCSYALCFSRTPLRAVAAAADKEQAGLIAEFMAAEARLNPWLEELMKFGNWSVEGRDTGSKLRILAAEEKSSYGLKEDFMVLDELTHWGKRGLWDTVVSGREKRPHAVLIVITNAGLLRTWQRDVFEEVKQDPDWYVYEAPGQLATWMSREKIDRLRRLVPAPLARRLYDNVWIDPTVEAGFVTRGEAEGCVDGSLAYRERGNPAHQYVASIDYAPVRDRTALAVGHEENGEVVIDRLQVVQGSKDRRVPIQLVEAWIDEVRQNFFNPTLVVDPYQMESTIQRYEGTLQVERFEARGGKTNYELANTLRGLVISNRLKVYPNAGSLLVDSRVEDFVDELSSVLLRNTSYGYRIDTQGSQHDDRVIAVGQLCVHLARGAGRISLPSSTRWF